eukprot:TRINITY_DN20399_c0_g1_i1.p1 TRINITY_DN20399_c0_g1~~TRINITY_DN20399_c0_g1_i1.p1  ORF type:complete len:219 (+),score=41.88 TRINITY_DN20399_c0_g1_i1:53-658(+)
MSNPEDDPVAVAKKALDIQMNAPPYNISSPMYIGREWQSCEEVNGLAFGKDQKYSGLAYDGVPKGWGVLEHHIGLLHACSNWNQGVADGPGMITQGDSIYYGNWVMGVRKGFFALVKEGGIYLEEYADNGELLRRIKWKRDKTHKACSRCSRKFNPPTNTESAPLCRYHPDESDPATGTYRCCGAMSVYNPLGCSLTLHKN